jgi:HAD superfamily hydrolase (TIGR01490 family)
MKELIIFDIDGTIVKGQSQRLFLKYLMSVNLITRSFYIKLMTWFILYKMGIVKDPEKPMKYAFSFLKGKSVVEIAKVSHDFFEKRLKLYIYPEALSIIDEHRRAGRTIILVSNAADIVVKEIAAHLGASEYICTLLETDSGFYNGKVNGSMYGEQKADAVKALSSKQGFDLKNAWAYGDHISDSHLLSLVGHPVAINPSPKLGSMARQKDWPILTFKDPQNKL